MWCAKTIMQRSLLAQKIDANFQMISIPASFDQVSEEPFDKTYMNELYELGYKMGQSGSAWTSKPEVF